MINDHGIEIGSVVFVVRPTSEPDQRAAKARAFLPTKLNGIARIAAGDFPLSCEVGTLLGSRSP